MKRDLTPSGSLLPISLVLAGVKLWGCALVLGLLAAGYSITAAPPKTPSTAAGGKVENYFRAVVEYFPQGTARTILEGKSAQPQPGGELLIEQLRLITLEAPGKTNMIVEAPQCFYDSAKKLAYSSGKLVCFTADRRFFITGEGFQWERNGRLMISNQVRTVIHRDMVMTQMKP